MEIFYIVGNFLLGGMGFVFLRCSNYLSLFISYFRRFAKSMHKMVQKIYVKYYAT